MKKTAATALTLGLALGLSAFAGPSYYDYSYSAKADYSYSTKSPVSDPTPQMQVPCFTEGELHLDLLSVYADPTGNQLASGVGGGIGLGYFFTERFGLMSRAYWWDAESVIHSITTSAVLRFPIQSICLAPYIYAGVGAHLDSVNQFGSHAGAGLEFRMTERLGLFADYSYTWAEETENWHLGTLGLRLAF